MPRALVAGAILLGGISHLSAQSDVLATLGTNAREANDSIFMTLTTGIPTLAGEQSVFGAASGEARASMVRAVVVIARAFAESAEFAKRSASYRDVQRPRRPDVPRTGNEARTQQQQAMEQAIKEAMANATRLSADSRKQLEDNIAEMRTQINELNADPDYRAAVDQMASSSAKQADDEFARKLVVFDADFPEDLNALIARRLQHFLLTCGEVDFDAALQMHPDKTMRFVNPVYESRSKEWKMCFRAGKPAVQAARAAADEWLNTLTP